jgi:hypothetical protein
MQRHSNLFVNCFYSLNLDLLSYIGFGLVDETGGAFGLRVQAHIPLPHHPCLPDISLLGLSVPEQ